MSETKFAPILPFEDTVLDSFCIYNSVKYTRDVDLAPDSCIAQHSPNMIKYFTTQNTEQIKIGGD